MKNNVTIKLLCLLSAILLMVSCRTSSKVSGWDDFKSRYAGDGVNVKVGGAIFKWGSGIAARATEDDEDAAALIRCLRKFRGVEVHAVPLKRIKFDAADVDRLDRSLQRDHYASLVTVRDGADHIHIWARGSEEEFRDPLILINDESDLVMVELKGVVTADDIGTLSRAGKGMYHF
ncbi:DUF4252 domain-containing protein [Compostibacter hankyongensis]|uniref:DUF4252 domain-containing protein n=1 Tax=Compostibacter hankyongensis TaxID=1007089 RepID=A0ABP8FK26_9BACT